MLERLDDFVSQLAAIDAQLADSQTMADMKKYTALMQERSRIAPIVEELERLKEIQSQLEDAREMARGEEDAELQEMAKEEITRLEKEAEESGKRAKMLLIPPDPLAGKNIIMEIRAGTGGDEASLFASDLMRMYTHYASSQSAARMSTAPCASRAALTASSVFPRPSPAEGYTPLPSLSQSCPRLRRPTSRSGPRT